MKLVSEGYHSEEPIVDRVDVFIPEVLFGSPGRGFIRLHVEPLP